MSEFRGSPKVLRGVIVLLNPESAAEWNMGLGSINGLQTEKDRMTQRAQLQKRGSGSSVATEAGRWLPRNEKNVAVHAEVPHSVHEPLHSPGQPLDKETRAFLEPRFGHDFSRVRIHVDAEATESARSVNALAYTVGRDVVFAAGQYAPRGDVGRNLIAHELAHVVQQRGATANVDSGVRVASRAEALEANANAAARAVLSGASPSNLLRTGGEVCLQRQVGPAQQIARMRRRINYRKAKLANERLSRPDNLGWTTKLETIAGGAYKSWADLWNAGEHNAFADAVAEFQVDHESTGKQVDGILGPGTWALIGGMGEAMAGIQKVARERSAQTCYEASRERIERGHKQATGEAFRLAEGQEQTTYNYILRSNAPHMLDIDEQYRGSGAAGAIVYSGFGEFVPEADIWNGGLRPGAAIQVWKHRDAYELLRAGEIEKKGKKRRISRDDANFYGTSYVFVRYDTENPGRVLVRHFGGSEWVDKSDWAVWIAANVSAPEQTEEAEGD